MKKIIILIMIVFLLLFPLVTSEVDNSSIKITDVYYNTQVGCEFIILENWGSPQDVSNYKITDNEGSLLLPNITIDRNQRLVITKDKDIYYNIWNYKADYSYNDLERKGQFNLARTGDEVLLKSNNKIIDSFYYGEIDTGEEWDGKSCDLLGYAQYAKRKDIDTNTPEDWNFTRKWKVGHTNFTSRKMIFNGTSSIYCSPDCSLESLIRFLNKVDRNLKIGIYEIDNIYITNKIANLSQKGVEVKILIDAKPVGGISDREKNCINLLKDSGVTIKYIGGEKYSPYSYFHCKYMIADNSSTLISSENFGYTGYPDNPTIGNRGWGVILENEDVTDYYSKVFNSDWRYGFYKELRDIETEPWKRYLGTYKPVYKNKTVNGSFKVTPVISPDTSISQKTIIDMIDSSNGSIYVQQFYIKNWPGRMNPYISHLLEAAERGVDVKILLDSTWYNIKDDEKDNDDMVKFLNNYSLKNNLSLEARLINREHGFSKVHNKGMIVDRKKVLISSINWNSNSILQNREIGVIVENKEVGRYFSKIFKHDWKADITEPIADAGRDRSCDIDKKITFNGSFSWDDKSIKTYYWDLNGDGKFEEEGMEVSKIFKEKGTYQIKIKVEDYEGNTDIDNATIQVRDGEKIDLSNSNSQYPILLISIFALIIMVVFIIYIRYK